jgi:hypothetical protein
MIIKKIFIGIIFCSSLSLYPMEQSLNHKTFFDKAIGSIAQSRAMNSFTSWLASKCPSQAPLAPLELQQLGAEAQADVDIPLERQLPIRQNLQDKDHDANTNPDAIYVTAKLLDEKTSYGYKRCVLYHEAIHAKYNDSAALIPVIGVPLATGIVGGLLLLKKMNPKGKLKLLYPLAALAGALSGILISGEYEPYGERRADIEGCYATQCSACVYETAQPCSDDYISPEGYLSKKELIQIAQDLEQQGKLCTYHRNKHN